jgi:hypothetical protein
VLQVEHEACVAGGAAARQCGRASSSQNAVRSVAASSAAPRQAGPASTQGAKWVECYIIL